MSRTKVFRDFLNKKTYLGNLDPGDCFIYNDRVMVRGTFDGITATIPCVSLEPPCGSLSLDPDTMVIPTDATITVKECG